MVDSDISALQLSTSGHKKRHPRFNNTSCTLVEVLAFELCSNKNCAARVRLESIVSAHPIGHLELSFFGFNQFSRRELSFLVSAPSPRKV